MRAIFLARLETFLHSRRDVIALMKWFFKPLHTSPLMRILDRSRICSLLSGSMRIARRGFVVRECENYLERDVSETHR